MNIMTLVHLPVTFAEAPWSVVESFDDVDEKLDAFHLLFDPILEQHAPIRRVKLRTRPNPFVTDEIINEN